MLSNVIGLIVAGFMLVCAIIALRIVKRLQKMEKQEEHEQNIKQG